MAYYQDYKAAILARYDASVAAIKAAGHSPAIERRLLASADARRRGELDYASDTICRLIDRYGE
jgi:hypothetical protein